MTVDDEECAVWNAATHLARGGKSSTKGGAIWYKITHGRRAKTWLVDNVLADMSRQGFHLDSLGENHRLAWDRGWRICGRSVSGKRTVPQGESRLIKPNPSENRVWRGLMKKLGHQVRELRGPGQTGLAAVVPRFGSSARRPVEKVGGRAVFGFPIGPGRTVSLRRTRSTFAHSVILARRMCALLGLETTPHTLYPSILSMTLNIVWQSDSFAFQFPFP
jgi:hypothetical protein